MKAKWFLWLVIAVGFSACTDIDEDPNAQLNKELEQIDTYLFNVGLTSQVLYDGNSGIRFVINSIGDGAPPHNGQKVKLTRVGKVLSDQSVFATGEIHDNIENVLPEGLRYSLGAILEGSSAVFYIPSKYAYGTVGAAGVAPNSPVIFEVFLEDVEKTAAEATQFSKDTAAIYKYIRDNSILNANYHPSGMVYTIDTLVSGDYPTPYKAVTFDYKLKLLTAPTAIVQDNRITNQNVYSLIDGLKVGLPIVETGSTVTFYIPSGLAYGTTANTGIPPNSNLIFQIKLISVGP